MRRLVLGSLLVLAGCGHRERTPALAPVRLTLSAPGDLSRVQAKHVTVSGTVSPPGARVLVAGAEADVRNGSFSARVELEGGANVIDVQADAPRHPAAMAAVRVTRLVPVTIPDLGGADPDAAVSALKAKGLMVAVHDSGLLDGLFPGSAHVCQTDPPAGTRVRVGSTVDVRTGKVC